MALPRVLLAWFVVGALAACSGDDERPSGPGTGGSGGAGASGGAAGSTATGGAAGSSGASGTAGTSGAAGTAGSAGQGGVGGGTDGGPIDPPCTSNTAFQATGAAFVFPTPQALATELSALTYDYNTHPLTVVLAAKPNGIGLLAVSVSEGEGVPKTFPAGKQPALVPATISAGGFSTASPQLAAWLRVIDQSGAKDIELENLELTATTGNNCSTLSATVSASIPVSQGSVTLDLPGGPKTIAELAGPNGGGQTPDAGAGYPLKLIFSAESTDFDFGSL